MCQIVLGPALKDKTDSPGIHKGLGSIFKTRQIQTDQDLSSSELTLISVLKIFLINLTLILLKGIIVLNA